MLKINGIEIKTPSGMEVGLTEIGDRSRRNAAGEQVIDRIAVKRRIHVVWSILQPSEAAALFSAIGAQAFFQVQYPDPLTGKARSAVCSCERQSAGVQRMENGAAIWKGVDMVWIER